MTATPDRRGECAPDCEACKHIPPCNDPDCLGCEWLDDGPTITVLGDSLDTLGWADWLRREMPDATVITPGLS